jgi:hypothetical protein
LDEAGAREHDALRGVGGIIWQHTITYGRIRSSAHAFLGFRAI